MTPEQIQACRDLLNYDAETGYFTWKVTRGGTARAGTRAGTPHKKGYVALIVGGYHLLAHRVAWALEHGPIPEDLQVDHKNGLRNENWFDNLRLGTQTTNQQNRKRAAKHSKTGILGVGRISPKSWSARITVARKSRYLGCFPSPEAAYAAYVQAKRELHAGNLL